MKMRYFCLNNQCPHKNDEGFIPTYADQRNQDSIDARIHIEEQYKKPSEIDRRNILYQRQHLETIQIKKKGKRADRHIYEEVPVFFGGTKFCCAKCAEQYATDRLLNEIDQSNGINQSNIIMPKDVIGFTCQNVNCRNLNKTFYLHGTYLKQRQSQQRSVERRILVQLQLAIEDTSVDVDINQANIDSNNKYVAGTKFCSVKCAEEATPTC